MFHLTHGSLTFGFGGGYMPSTIKQNHANNMQNQAKSSKIMSCKNHAKIVQNELLVSSVYRHTDYTHSIFQRKPVRKRLFSPAFTGKYTRGECAAHQKTGPVKKKNNRLRRPRTAAPGLARGRMEPSC